jgi:hypothetical protein
VAISLCAREWVRVKRSPVLSLYSVEFPSLNI